MKVSDIMTAACLTDSPDDTVAEASAKMRQNQTGSILVMDAGRLTGILTERDVLRVVAEGKDPKVVSVQDEMTSDPVTIPPHTALRDAAQTMFDKWFRHLPVMTNEGDVVGIISLRDLLTIVADSLEEPTALQNLTGHKLVRDRRLERVEIGDLD
ncbi:MAG TPA: CBS domain-containing protein [Actinomycetota bacterium]|nr:CBS domain-containing protein [Actinomycetota bacterium]